MLPPTLTLAVKVLPRPFPLSIYTVVPAPRTFVHARDPKSRDLPYQDPALLCELHDDF